MRDHLGRPVVVVTGLGLATPLGFGREDNWRKLTAGESGIHEITRFPIDGLRTRIAGTIDGLDIDPMSAPELSLRLAQMAMREAAEQAGVAKGTFPGPLFLAVPPVEMEWSHKFDVRSHVETAARGYAAMLEAARKTRFEAMHELIQFGRTADRLQDEFGTRGLPISLSTACASGATAVQMGAEAIRRGETDAAFCVGTDGSVHVESLIRFSLLSALSTQNEPPEEASKPFSKDRDGFVMAEGAGALVLESYERAKARGAAVLAILRGCGEKADDFHRTRSSPDGSPAIAAVERALADANLAAADLSTINAHGTSTPENDKMEALSLTTALGEHAASIPITSNKSMIGHTLTAAGAIEAVFSCLTLLQGRVPPTINYRNPDPDIGLDVVSEARDLQATSVMSNSFGFGGQNACLVFGTEAG